jgi:phosphate transport system permease protein
MTLTIKERWRRSRSGVMFTLCIGAAFMIVGILGWVMGYLIKLGGGSISLGLLTRLPQGDVSDPGGMGHAVLGTLILLGLASVVGIPVGMMTGVYLSEYSTERALAWPVRFVCDVLAGVPSIVVGILGYELLVVPLGHFNGWAGALALAFIMVPIVARTTEEMLSLVPASYRAASLALGATQSQTILRVVIPAATGSLVTGVMLALARVAGETAPLLFTALGSRLLTINPNQPFPSLTVQVFTWATGPYEEQRRLAWAGILVLIALLFVLNLAIRYTASRSMGRGSSA